MKSEELSRYCVLNDSEEDVAEAGEGGPDERIERSILRYIEKYQVVKDEPGRCPRKNYQEQAGGFEPVFREKIVSAPKPFFESHHR